MIEMKVSYYLTNEQMIKLKALTDAYNATVASPTTCVEMFETIMLAGSRHDIDAKLDMWNDAVARRKNRPHRTAIR